jgi:rhomboid protease GluP
VLFVSPVLIAVLIWYFMTPAERDRVLRAATRQVARLKTAVAVWRGQRDETMDRALRERTPWPVVTAVAAGLNFALFVWIQLDPTVPLVEVLGNFAPRTTNGEWWRLATAVFIHANAFQLVLNTVALVQAGLVLERLVGSVTFGTAYLAAGVFAGLLTLAGSGATMTLGASSAIFGIYGLLIATWMWGACQRAQFTIRLRVVKRLAPAAVVFAVFNLLTAANTTAAECMGLVVGFVFGVMTTRGVRFEKPRSRRIATVAAASAYLWIVAAVTLAGVSDVRPTLARTVAVEQRTAAAYEAALAEFRDNRVDRRRLAQLIDRSIVPDLLVVRFELQALDRPPREHRPLVEGAEIYALRRIESWKLRSRALRTADWRQLRDADALEHAALEKLRVITAMLKAEG